jgi:hypothetical protein
MGGSKRPAYGVHPVATVVAVLCVLWATLPACNSTRPLVNTYASPDALASAVLESLAARDRKTLEGLALSEQEFREHVWPDLPAARPERNLPFSYVWGDLSQKSQASLTGTLSAHGGKRYHLLRTRFDGATSTYASSSVHRKTILTIRDEHGHQEDVRLFGSTIEQGGRWKVFSYVVE